MFTLRNVFFFFICRVYYSMSLQNVDPTRFCTRSASLPAVLVVATWWRNRPTPGSMVTRGPWLVLGCDRGTSSPLWSLCRRKVSVTIKEFASTYQYKMSAVDYLLWSQKERIVIYSVYFGMKCYSSISNKFGEGFFLPKWDINYSCGHGDL